MKLSRFIVSVNLAATIPVAVQAAATAEERIGGGWLKDSVSSLDKATAQATPDKKSAAIAKAVATARANDCFAVNSQKTRPFMPNHPLPHRVDLELQALTPKLAPEPKPALSGQVSSYYATDSSADAGYQNMSPTAAVGLRKNESKRERVTEMMRSVLKYVTPTGNADPPRSMPILTSLQQRPFGSAAGRESAAVAPELAYPMMRQAERVMLKATSTGALGANSTVPGVANREAGLKNQVAEASTTNSAGPPPFPLNLLPEASLKQFVRGSSAKAKLGPRVYFGCWHNCGTSRLAPAGFQNYAGGGASRHMLARSGRIAYASRADGLLRKKHAHSMAHNFIGPRRAVVPEANVAVYPPYAGQSRFY